MCLRLEDCCRIQALSGGFDEIADIRKTSFDIERGRRLNALDSQCRSNLHRDRRLLLVSRLAGLSGFL